MAGSAFGPAGLAVGTFGFGLGFGVGSVIDQRWGDDLDGALDDAGYLIDELSRPQLMTARGNHGHPHIRERAQARVDSGEFPDLASALRAEYQEARNAGLSEEAAKIKGEQKHQNCRRHR
ncbi:MAG: hypothetical protein Q8S73_43630 [Deltaproteobacteria bacterium]|nr:hypothetical protein [Myxococcales bacterium]MDP3221056.1 hypothetical protein [Deltaproteobacteria bacterium]